MKKNVFLLVVLSLQVSISVAFEAFISGARRKSLISLDSEIADPGSRGSRDSLTRNESPVGGWMQNSSERGFAGLVQEVITGIQDSSSAPAGAVVIYDVADQRYTNVGSFVGTRSGLNVLAHNLETGEYTSAPVHRLVRLAAVERRDSMQIVNPVAAPQTPIADGSARLACQVGAPQVEVVSVKISSRWCGCFGK